jgi:hypothetical protein
MKRMKYLFCLAGTILLLCILSPTVIKASMPSEIQAEFSKALEEQLKTTINYYYENSGTIIDSMHMPKANIMKILETDDPDTPENEEKIEEYQADIVAAFVEFEQQRDTIFFFKKTEMYYYDLENEEFLTASNVFLNEEVKDFFNSYVKDLGKHITPMSVVITIGVIMVSILFIPLLIMIFHHKGGSNPHATSMENTFRG